MFLADYGNQAIRRLDTRLRTVETLISKRGSSDGQFDSTPNSIGEILPTHSLEKCNDTYIIAVDTSNNLRLIDMAKSIISTMQPSQSVQLVRNTVVSRQKL